MMMEGLTRALRLEFSSMRERWLSLFFYLLVPAIIVFIYYASTKNIINWGSYASLNLRLYDIFASGVFSIIIMFVTIQLMVLRIVGERAPYGTLDRELIAISRSGVYFGKLFANFFLVLLQVIIIYLFGYVILSAKNYGNPTSILLILLLVGVFGLILGFVISVFSKNKEQAIQLVPFFILVLLLFSGILIPLEQMPSSMKLVAENMPLTLGQQSLQIISLDGAGFEDIQFNILKFLVWIIVLVLIGLVKFKLERKK